MKQHHAAEWFAFKHPVEKHIVFSYKRYLHKNTPPHCIFATAVETAYDIAADTKKTVQNVFYLIQDFENWNGNTDDYVYHSYTFPFHKIVISKWLQERVEKTGNTATLIVNGLDFSYFTLTKPIAERKPTEIAMLYHLDDRKRCVDAMDALEIVKKHMPDLHVTMFGVPERPDNLPDWYTYYQTPDKETHNHIYNTAAIFVAASMKEGWALPPAEAMQCGCALCCTDIDGFKEYALPNTTALVSPVYDVQVLAKNILALITDVPLRIQLATAGHAHIQQFTWDDSFSKMKTLVETYIAD